MLVVAGITMTIIFQLAHVVPHCETESGPANLAGKNWHVYQLQTTCDFAHGNKLVSYLIGGLNYQVEHHLFPSMPRPNLKKAQAIVKDFCAEHTVPYVETRHFQSYGIVINYLNKVGLKDSDPFMCPLVNQLRQLPAAS